MIELLPFTPRSAAKQACLLRVSYNLHVCCRHQQTTNSTLGTEAFMVLHPVISLGLRVYILGVLLVLGDAKKGNEGCSGIFDYGLRLHRV